MTTTYNFAVCADLNERNEYVGDVFNVEGSIYIEADLGEVVFKNHIYARRSIVAAEGSGISADKGISAGECILAGKGILAGEGISAGWGIQE